MSKSKAKARSRQNKPAPKAGGGINWLWVGLALAAVVIVGFAVVQMLNSGPSTAVQAGGLPAEISVADAARMYTDGAFLLDVREPHEWAAYHVPNTTLIPLGELSRRVNELPRDREIVVVCRSGNRSQEGAALLRQAGFAQVTSMAGGLLEWQARGYPTESGNG